MKLVIFNWRDINHPKSGGAEYSTHVLVRGLAALGHDVTWYTSRPAGAAEEEFRDGYRVIRAGNEVSCRFHALKWLRQRAHAFDIVIDEVNTLPFLSRLCARNVVLWMHQIAREIWLYEAPKPWGMLGYALEPWLMRVYRGARIVTVSRSTAESLREIGVSGRVDIIENAIEAPVDETLPPRVGRVAYVGRLAPSKRVGDIVRAVAILIDDFPEARLDIVGTGSDSETRALVNTANALGVAHAVKFHGRVPDVRRDEIMSRADVLAMASVREGWGLVVSEAARFGVPSVVYPVPGLVDSVQHGKTGLIVPAATPQDLARGLHSVIRDRELRSSLGRNAAAYISELSEHRFVKRFEEVLLDAAAQARPAREGA